ncbi:MAG: hypothetical protein Q9163_005657, partial [Psora crenata]
MGVDGLDHALQSSSSSATRERSSAKGDLKTARIVPEDENYVQLPTPKTPRHRDFLSKKIPITPRHRIGLAGKAATPRTPRTPLTPRSVPIVYNSARNLFIRGTYPVRLVGRDEEKGQVQAFFEETVGSKSGGSMYISGPPGTGKTALVSEICSDFQGTEGVKMAYINCMSLKASEDIYRKIASEILSEDDPFLERNTEAHLQSIFVKKRRSEGLTYVVTLDEIDHLLTLDLKILYTLFEWTLHRDSRLVVIGIANALDLTDRLLPKLKIRNLKPRLLPLLPYTAPQIASIITTKLRSLLSQDSTHQPDFVPFIHPAAIQLCSKKVASQTGDIRKAFDIIRRTIDLIETETKEKHEAENPSLSLLFSPTKSPLVENPNLASPSLRRAPTAAASLAKLTPLTAPRATIAHVSRVSAAAFSNGTSQRLQKLNLQQKAALCALLSYQRTTRNTTPSIFTTPTKASSVVPTVKRLYKTYCGL